MHTKLQLKAFLLHQNLIYNLYGNTLPAVISFMLPLSNYYNIGSESYFLNVPLFNYKVIFKYSYFIIPRMLLCSLCHSPYYLTDSIFWRFPFISESAFFFFKSQCVQLPFSSSFPRQKGIVWLLQPCSHTSLSFVSFCRDWCQELSRNLPGNGIIPGCTMHCFCSHSYIAVLPLQCLAVFLFIFLLFFPCCLFIYFHLLF